MCSTKYCLLDANRFIIAATQNQSVLPCDNFLEFAMGELLKHKALHDRYTHVGFARDINHLLIEKHRKLLSQSSKPKESKVFKVMRNYFQKCVDSG